MADTPELAAARVAHVRELVLGPPDAPRLLQSAPVLADVWINYAAAPDEPQPLLLVPWRDMPAGKAARRLREALRRARIEAPVASAQGVIATKLDVRAFLRCVIPAMGPWRGAPRGQWPAWFLQLIDELGQRPPDAGRLEDPFVGRVQTDRRCRRAALPPTRNAMRSCITVKADAALNLFGISCREVRWAVLDEGINGAHPAFRDHGVAERRSRVIATYNFVGLRDRIDAIVEWRAEKPGTADLLERVGRSLQVLQPELAGDALAKAVRKRIVMLRRRLAEGRDLDWELFEPFVFEVEPELPQNDHGTAVAGVIGADWRVGVDGEPNPPDDIPMIGTCPDIQLYDVRVVPDGFDEQASEFDVIAALQFLRFLNDRTDVRRIEVHGANLSLATPHNVDSYACGATLICQECDRLSANGVVVVAAAGNGGYSKEASGRGRYAVMSITDPGNAETAITVGATHSVAPHRYGVSWFSGRGPTGDGRQKPDLVAPGERITAPLCDTGAVEEQSGTSFAAPHVSGAAALLMARHTELQGKPARIKEILCRTATDLGRERSFQGAGLLDVLRALQNP